MEIEKIQKYFEILEKRKNFSERKYLSTELLDRLGIKKYRKLIEENDDVIFNGECGFKLKEETYEEIRKILSEVYKDAYDLEDEEEKEMFYEHIDSFFDNEKFLKVWRLSFEDIILEECVETWKPSVRHSYLNKDWEENLIPFELIQNDEDGIFLLHKITGEIYFYYAFIFAVKVADSFDEFIDRIEEI